MNRRGVVIDKLVSGTFTDPKTRKTHAIPIRSIEIADTLAGEEARLVRACHGGAKITVVHDAFTRDALGARVFGALKADGGPVDEFVWRTPRCSAEGVRELSAATKAADALVAVGSGTVSDSCKYATFLDGRTYSVFATSPMNAYTTSTASLSEGGLKRSISCHSARGVFFDLDVLSRCPKRLIAAAFADVICRTTAQVDWLLSHLLFDTPYSDVAYTLLAPDENAMIAAANAIGRGEPEALATLTRVSAIMGLSTSFTGTTHVGSMAEHMISPSIDMFADPHPRPHHGEQVGVATLVMSRLQNAIRDETGPPELSPTAIPADRLAATYGDAMAATMAEATRKKALDSAGTNRLNARLAGHWPEICDTLRPALRPPDEIDDAMAAAGCRRTFGELGVAPDFARQVVRDARFIRDRYSMLDLADDAGRLTPFLETVR